MLDTESKRTICTALRELFRYMLKHQNSDFEDMKELLTYAYISAKKMNKRLCEYAGKKIDEHDTEERWIDQLREVKREHDENTLR
jgi:hypothetical protein